MIMDLAKFARLREPSWKKLEEMLEQVDRRSGEPVRYEDALEIHRLYCKVSDDLARLSSMSGEDELRTYLETLVAKAYSLIHDLDRKKFAPAPIRFIFREFPATFRRNISYFMVSSVLFGLGALFGFFCVAFFPEAKEAIVPPCFSHLHQSAQERVASEEQSLSNDPFAGKSQFAVQLFSNNTRVSIFVLSLGISFGIGSGILLFYNGIILGAVLGDFILNGYYLFVFGWLLPHGVVEIPSVLIAGQAAMMIGASLFYPGNEGRIARLKERMPDIVRLIAGTAFLLIYAGLVEAFFSQMHEPFLSYEWKIVFALVEAFILSAWLAYGGRTIPGSPAQTGTEASRRSVK